MTDEEIPLLEEKAKDLKNDKTFVLNIDHETLDLMERFRKTLTYTSDEMQELQKVLHPPPQTQFWDFVNKFKYQICISFLVIFGVFAFAGFQTGQGINLSPDAQAKLLEKAIDCSKK